MPKASNIAAKIAKAANDARVCKPLLQRLASCLAGRNMRFMEVCGTHTVSIFQSGLASILPREIIHISGPGCPVCVTHETEVALFLNLAREKDVIIATFGDLLRVPGPDGESLKHAQARGARVEIVYSPLEALALATHNPERQVVFLGIGFETTAPTVAAAILTAQAKGIENFCVLSLHKLVPPVLRELLEQDAANLDAFLLPGHVATVTGIEPFQFLVQEYGKPAVVSGFEPADILLALCVLAENLDTPLVANAYKRAVADQGNSRCQQLLEHVFSPGPGLWRGFGQIPDSGLAIRPEFAAYDAMAKLSLSLPKTVARTGCACGKVLAGRILPPECPLFGKACSPQSPLGPCMVSTEGSCAAWHKYGGL